MKKSLFLLLLIIGLFSCMQNPGTGSEIGNGFSAKLYDHDGTPAIGAKVLFVPVDYAPDIGAYQNQSAEICSTYTNNKGEYSFDSVSGGTYNIFGKKDDYQSFQDSVPVAAGVAEVQSDTLRLTGSVISHIELSNGLDYKTLIVIALGSRNFAFIDSTGAFSLSNMAEGRYAVRILTTLDDWEAKDTVFSIISGKDETNEDTIKLAYKGVPWPTGLTIQYDTLNQTAILTWNPVDSSLIAGFNIYRSIKGRNFSLITQDPLPKTTLEYRDTNLVIDSTYEYRIVSRNKAGKESDFIDIPGDTVKAVSMDLAKTILTLETLNTLHDTASINDTLTWILSYKNPTRIIRKVEWHINKDSIVQFKNDSLLSGVDTLVHSWPKAGIQVVYVQVTDAANTIWKDSARVAIVQDAPSVSITGASAILINTPLTLTASTSQKFGTIVRYQWSNSLGIPSIDSAGQAYMCTFKAETTVTVTVEITDDDGNTSKASKNVTITNDKPAVTGLKDTTISINDTIAFKATAFDSNGVVQKYYWNFGDGSSNQFDTTNTGTIPHQFPSSPMKCTTSVTVTDSFGKPGTKKAVINVILDPPIAYAGKDTTISINDSFTTHGSGSDAYGKIVMYRFDANGDGIFEDSSASTGMKRFKGPSIPGHYNVILQVLDDDGNKNNDAMDIQVALDMPVPFAGNDTAVPRGTTVRLRGRADDTLGSIVKYEWDLGNTGLFAISENGGADFTAPDSFVFDGVKCILRVTDDDDNVSADTTTIFVGVVQHVLNAVNFPERIDYTSVVFDDKLWVIAGASGIGFGNDVWNSADGLHWNQVKPINASGFSDRYAHASVVFDNKLWVIGGDLGNGFTNDVWYSNDGATWVEATPHAGFSPRRDLGCIVFDDKIWVIGGQSNNFRTVNDIWCSTDGVTWNQVVPADSTPFSKRIWSSLIVFNQKLWLMGGFFQDEEESEIFNDIWYSPDGKQWRQSSIASDTLMRIGRASVVYDNNMWVIGGWEKDLSGLQDIVPANQIWFSSDGTKWNKFEQTGNLPVSDAAAAFAFKNSIWLLGTGNMWNIK